MTPGDGLEQTKDFTIRVGTTADLDAVKAIASVEKRALGFVHRGALSRAANREELLVASLGTVIVGFCQFYRRRDGISTIYHLAVARGMRERGIGRELLARVALDAERLGMQAVRLKCPSDLPANSFYARAGFTDVGREQGTNRVLRIWERPVSARNDAGRDSASVQRREFSS